MLAGHMRNRVLAGAGNGFGWCGEWLWLVRGMALAGVLRQFSGGIARAGEVARDATAAASSKSLCLRRLCEQMLSIYGIIRV